MGSLREHGVVAARALEFAILTAARTGEVMGARWSEIDWSNKLWAIPANRMKSGREHRVPLGPRALAILDEMKPLAHCGGGLDLDQACVFPGAKVGRPLSNMALPHAVAAHVSEWTDRPWFPQQLS